MFGRATITLGIGPHSSTWFFMPPEFTPKGYLDRFSRFCRADDRDSWDRQTDRPSYFGNSRPHLQYM